MSTGTLITRQSLSMLARDRSVLLLIAFFAAMVAVTAWLGWSATDTVNAIYADAARYLATAGQAVPDNPVKAGAPLAVLRNLVVYVSLVGAFGAIVIGHLLIDTERRAGTLPLIGSRAITAGQLAAGKIGALLVATASLMGVAGAIAAFTLFALPALAIGGTDLVHLGAFLLAGWAYIALFGLVALGAAARFPGTAGGMIIATVVWLVITFVLPALTANVHPTAAINPIAALVVVPDSPVFHTLATLLGPLSVAEAFDWLSASTMGYLPETASPRGMVPPAVVLTLALLLAAVFAVRAVGTLDLNQDNDND